MTSFKCYGSIIIEPKCYGIKKTRIGNSYRNFFAIFKQFGTGKFSRNMDVSDLVIHFIFILCNVGTVIDVVVVVVVVVVVIGTAAVR